MAGVSVENEVSVENKPVVQVKKFVCDLCEKGFDKEGPLANHRIHVHTLRIKEMFCDFCENIFENKIDLCSHMSSKHSEHFVKKEDISATNLEEEVKNKESGAKESDLDGGQIDSIKPEEKSERENVKVKLNYVLDQLKNLKVAKLNAKRSMHYAEVPL